VFYRALAAFWKKPCGVIHYSLLPKTAWFSQTGSGVARTHFQSSPHISLQSMAATFKDPSLIFLSSCQVEPFSKILPGPVHFRSPEFWACINLRFRNLPVDTARSHGSLVLNTFLRTSQGVPFKENAKQHQRGSLHTMRPFQSQKTLPGSTGHGFD
jgi:hypothetical protein